MKIGQIIDGINGLPAAERHDAIQDLVFALVAVQGCAASNYLGNLAGDAAIDQAASHADYGLKQAEEAVAKAVVA